MEPNVFHAGDLIICRHSGIYSVTNEHAVCKVIKYADEPYQYNLIVEVVSLFPTHMEFRRYSKFGATALKWQEFYVQPDYFRHYSRELCGKYNIIVKEVIQ